MHLTRSTCLDNQKGYPLSSTTAKRPNIIQYPDGRYFVPVGDDRATVVSPDVSRATISAAERCASADQSMVGGEVDVWFSLDLPFKRRDTNRSHSSQLSLPSGTLQLLLQPHFNPRLVGNISSVRRCLDGIKKMLRKP
jgi:hypothetical protein